MQFTRLISQLTNLPWERLSTEELEATSRAYYYFSIQFRENLQLACAMRPYDADLQELRAGECDTDNLSPYPGVAEAGERMNHDDFMLRSLALSSMSVGNRERIDALGHIYLAEVRVADPIAKMLSISSYEDGGLEAVFRAILRAPDWDNASLGAFKHFLVEHIRFDSDPDAGHGALSRHLVPDDRVLPMWRAFYNLLIGAAPSLTMPVLEPAELTT